MTLTATRDETRGLTPKPHHLVMVRRNATMWINRGTATVFIDADEGAHFGTAETIADGTYPDHPPALPLNDSHVPAISAAGHTIVYISDPSPQVVDSSSASLGELGVAYGTAGIGLPDATDKIVSPEPSYVAQRAATQRARAFSSTFESLAEKWRTETRMLSSIHQIAMHLAYQQIIGMGRDVIPLILHELRDRPGHWFWALHAISRQNPVPPEHSGDVDRMAEDWTEWGRENGLI